MTAKHIWDKTAAADLAGQFEAGANTNQTHVAALNISASTFAPVAGAMFDNGGSTFASINSDTMGISHFTAGNAMAYGVPPALDSFGTTVTAKAITPVVVAPKTEVFATGATPVSYTQISQGQVGDCFVLSPMGTLANENPAFIQNMIHINTNGTESVTLYEAANGSKVGFSTTSFKAVTEVVTNNFASNSVNNGSTQAMQNGTKIIWPNILEQAMAQLNGTTNLNSIANGGYPSLSLEQLTGKVATANGTNVMTAATINADLTAKDMITLDSAVNNTQFNIVGGHSYMVVGSATIGGVACAEVNNPWGFNAPGTNTIAGTGTGYIPMTKLASLFCEMDVGHF